MSATAEARTSAPSGWKVEQAMSAWMAARARLLVEDVGLANDETALAALLGPEEGDVRDIVMRLLRAIVHAEDMQAAAADRAKIIAARAKRYAARADAMRGTALAIMDAMGVRAEEFPDMTVSVISGRLGVVIDDETAIPDEFCKVERTPKKKELFAEIIERNRLRQSLINLAQAGGFEVDPATLPGPVPGARIEIGLPSLTIRTR
jgi:Siphovirus Gp157